MMPKKNINLPFVVKQEHVIPLDDHKLKRLYTWVDMIPLSRPKKQLNRDFSDGVLFAEVIKYFLPKYVDLHNFTTASSSRTKENNWFHLNRKVLNQIRLEISHEVIHDIANYKPWVIEHTLCVLRNRIEDELANLHAQKHQIDEEFKAWIRSDEKPEVDQGLASGRKSDFQSLDDFYMAQGLKVFPDERDYLPHEPIMVSPRHQRVQEMVPRSELMDRVQVCDDKQEMIDTLHRKIKRLDNLLHLKDLRIQDMTSRMLSIQDQISGPADDVFVSPKTTRRGNPTNTASFQQGSPPIARKFKVAPPGRQPRRAVMAGGITSHR